MSFQTQVLAFLEASLLRPLVLVAAAWLILRVFRVKHPASRHSVWTAVLIGMLALPIVSVIVPRLTLRVLPTAAETTSRATAPASADPETPRIADTVSPGPTVAVAPVPAPPSAFAWPSSETLIVSVYAIGFVAMVAYRLMGWLLLRRVVSRSTALRPIYLRESADVVTPVAVGVFRRAVILPAGWRGWSTHTKRAVLAHEFAHLRRGDTLVAALARFVKTVFWFNPIAWWVSRQTSDLAELACDAVALQRVGDPAGYSRVLVAFAEAVSRSGERVALPGLAMASGSRMSGRIDQVFEMSSGTMRKLRRPRVWLVGIGLPMLCLASTVAIGAGQAAISTQGTADKSPKFDVVSIKPCPGLDVVRPPGSGRGANPRAPQISPGYMHWDCVTLAELVEQAYTGKGNQLLNVIDLRIEDSPKRVRGGPSWMESDRFTIETRVTGDTTDLTGAGRFVMVRDAMMPALRTMIEDRFQLKLHKATEQQSMYALTVAPSGLNKTKMTTPAPGDCWEMVPGRGRGAPPPGFEGKSACGFVRGRRSQGNRKNEYTSNTMADLARELSGLMNRFVLDKTNIAGKFSFTIEYAPDDNTPGDRMDPAKAAERAAEMAAAGLSDPRPDGPTIFKALEALGLKLEPTKGPAEYLVIDHVEKPRPNEPALEAAPAGASGPHDTSADSVPQNPPAAAAPRFDVVSIKPCPDVSTANTGRGAGPNLAQTSPGHVYWACVTLASLVDQAYASGDFSLLNNRSQALAFESSLDGRRLGDGSGGDGPKRVTGGPSWIHSDRWAIEATAPVDVINPPAGARNLLSLPGPMNAALREMLADRFQLKMRRATEEIPMYSLVVAPGGLKIKAPTPGDCVVYATGMPRSTPSGDKGYCGSISMTAPLAKLDRLKAGVDRATIESLGGPDRRFEANGVTLQKVAEYLNGVMDRFVLDKTGVAGEFMFAIEFTKNDNTPGRNYGVFLSPDARQPPPAGSRINLAPIGPDQTIFKALEAIGLKLEQAKGPSEYLVIESAQKPKPDRPTPR